MIKQPIIITAGEPNSVFLEIFFKSIRGSYRKPLILIASKKLLLSQMKQLKFNYKVELVDKKKLEFFYKQKLEDNSIKIDEVKRIFERCDIPLLIQKLIEDYTTSSFNLLEKMNISESNKEKLISFGAFLMGRNK